MASIPHTYIQSGRYYFRRRARLTESLLARVTVALGTREPALARHRAAGLSVRFTELAGRVAMFIERGDRLTQAMIDEMFDAELRKCLDDLLLGFHAADDPHAVAGAYRTAAAAFRLAQRPAAKREIGVEERERLLAQGFDMHSIENVACDLDRYAHPDHVATAIIEEWIAAFGMLPSRASYGSIAAVITRAHGRAHELASRYLDSEIQDAIDPATALTKRARDESFRPTGLAGALSCNSPVEPVEPPALATALRTSDASSPSPRSNSRFLVHSSRRFSEIIEEVATAMKAEKRWTGDISQQMRVMRSFAWITGDKALGDYTHLDVGEFKKALQLLPRGFKWQDHFDQPYEAVASKVAADKAVYEKATDKSTLKPFVPRQAVTINRDLSYMSTVAGYLAQNEWAPIIPNTEVLKFTSALIRNAKPKGKTPIRPPWKVSQLRELFTAPVWTGGRGHLQRLHPAPPEDVYQDAGYWLPLLLYYSHAALNEIAGLKLDEVSLDTPVPFVTVQNNNLRGTDEELRGEKRAARGRDIPLHKEITRLGFREYVEAMRNEGHAALFPELWINSRKKGGAQFRERAWMPLMIWAEQRMSLPTGLNGKGVDLHSIRKTGSGFYAVENVPDTVRADIMGHARTGTNGLHYSFRELSEEQYVALGEARDLMESRITVITGHLQSHGFKILPLSHRSRFGAPPKKYD
jgi:integrase